MPGGSVSKLGTVPAGSTGAFGIRLLGEQPEVVEHGAAVRVLVDERVRRVLVGIGRARGLALLGAVLLVLVLLLVLSRGSAVASSPGKMPSPSVGSLNARVVEVVLEVVVRRRAGSARCRRARRARRGGGGGARRRGGWRRTGDRAEPGDAWPRTASRRSRDGHRRSAPGGRRAGRCTRDRTWCRAVRCRPRSSRRRWRCG